jgi:hypothetical protein
MRYSSISRTLAGRRLPLPSAKLLFEAFGCVCRSMHRPPLLAGIVGHRGDRSTVEYRLRCDISWLPSLRRRRRTVYNRRSCRWTGMGTSCVAKVASRTELAGPTARVAVRCAQCAQKLLGQTALVNHIHAEHTQSSTLCRLMLLADLRTGTTLTVRKSYRSSCANEPPRRRKRTGLVSSAARQA